jgi:cell division protein FtsQ
MTVVRKMKPGRVVAISIVGILMIVLMAELLWNLAIAPRLIIRKITLESDLGLTDSQILEMLNIKGETWASLEESVLKNRLEAYPVVRKAQVVKVFPDTLRLYVYRRRPLAVALFDDGLTPIPAVFDEEGYAVQVGVGSGSLDLPILSGPRFSEPALGARMPESIQVILGDLSRLRADDPKLFALVSEIEIVPHGTEGYDLKLYMNHIPIPILVDRNLTAESIRQAVLVLDVLASGSAGRVEEADMRGGHVVFRTVEES